LLALGIFLIFSGTWAQVDMGIWSTVDTYFHSFFLVIPFQIFFPRSWDIPGGLPFPGGYLIGGLLAINLIAAHLTRFKFTWKRSGIFLTHLGVFLLLVGEFVAATRAVESMMSIDEGQTTSYAEDTREVELAVLEPLDSSQDRVVAVPASRLEKQKWIKHPQLPFDVRVDSYYKNADLMRGEDLGQKDNKATRGIGVNANIMAVQRPVVSGVEQNVIDLPAAYVTLFRDGNELGTWLVSLFFSMMEMGRPQTVTVAGKDYRMALRYKRQYKPYQVHLIDFKHDRYLGTNTPRNYSSRIQLVDAKHNVDREVLIYMNHPLRYRGETFFQASFKQGDGGTVLQVVRNPGWLLPYVACAIGALGLLIQFGLHLTGFLRRGRWV